VQVFNCLYSYNVYLHLSVMSRETKARLDMADK